jgi:sugar O-acyltransferase (sialic acid O-acetyltransferase NeuD family)
MDELRRPARVAIIGAGGHAREVLDAYQACNAAGWGPIEVVGFLADSPKADATVNGISVLGSVEWLASQEDPPLVLAAIGDPDTRRRLVERAVALGARFHRLIHPAAVVGSRVEIGPGSFITAGCVLTSDIALGSHVIVNVAATVAHDCRLGDYATLAPGVHLSGAVTIGAGANLGTGAVTVQGVRIGEGAIIGAGAVVTEDVPADSVAVGVPARVVHPADRRWADG